MSDISQIPPGRHIFSCIDGHTCGNPVRLVIGGGPFLRGATMSARRQDFVTRFDWVRRSLMFIQRPSSSCASKVRAPGWPSSLITVVRMTGFRPLATTVSYGAPATTARGS